LIERKAGRVPAFLLPVSRPRGGAFGLHLAHFGRTCGLRVTVFRNHVGYVDIRPRKQPTAKYRSA
jgi:hypothetical protein